KSLIYIVREDHVVVAQGTKEPQNVIVVIDPETKLQSVLVSGADFYSCPRVSPDGYKIAWDLVESSKHESISNNNISLTCCFVCVSPFKSWDSTDIWLAELPQSGLEILPGTQQKEFGILDTKEQSYRKVETGLTTHDRFGWTSRGSIYSIVYSLPRSLEWMLIQKRSKLLKCLCLLGYFSIPEKISWQTTDNEISFGFYYTPTNKDFNAPD
ncbi:Dipeptidyl aminopeptidase BIII, partial [Biomphalaria glabrata]